MTDTAADRKPPSGGTKRRRSAKRDYALKFETKDGAFRFTADISIEGRTASSSALVNAMPPYEAIWPEAQRKEWIGRLLGMAPIDKDPDLVGRVCNAYLSLLTVAMEFGDAESAERARSMPKPALKIVGGYDRKRSPKPAARPIST